MSLQFSTALRTALCSAIISTIGGTGSLKVFTGAMPANPATADSGTQLSHFALPATPLTAAAGVLSMSGTWEEAAADAAGVAGYFRIYDGSAVCHLQGTITATAGSGDMTLDNTNLAAGQDFKVTSFTLTAPSA